MQLTQHRGFAYAAFAALACLVPVLASAQAKPWQLAADSLLYTDTDNVLVVTTQAGGSRALDEDGGAVVVSGVVDVVSAASVDVVSQATTRFDEVRGELNVGVSHAVGEGMPSLSYRGSTEPDYVSHGFGGGYRTRLGSPDTVASAHYQLTLDTIGRTGTPFSSFSRQLTTHSGEVGVTQNLSTRALLRGVYTLTVQDGYLEKPYRFVPLFDRAGLDRAAADAVALDLDSFDRYRLAARPAEEVPDLRVRHAIALRGLLYVDAIDGSLRLDYRFYFDDWAQLAHTAELALEMPWSDLFGFGAYVRAHSQSSTSFYRSTYVVGSSEEIPRLRTVDRKLSAYDTWTAAARITLHVGDFSAYFEPSAAYTSYHDFIYLDHLIALVGQGGVTWVF